MTQREKDIKAVEITLLIVLLAMALMFAGCTGGRSCPKMNWSDARAKYLR